MKPVVFSHPHGGLGKETLVPHIYLFFAWTCLPNSFFVIPWILRTGIGVNIAPQAEKIPYLLFADDSLLFWKASFQTTFTLKGVLDSFCLQSRQLVNFHKSSIVFSQHTPRQVKLHVAGIFNVPHTSSSRNTWAALFSRVSPRSIYSRISFVKPTLN